jgi:predicted nucleic acid-binding protein
MHVFVDSDVIISSLISNRGAAYFLVHQPNITCSISTFSLKELRIVVKRLSLSSEVFEMLVDQQLQLQTLEDGGATIQKQYAHVVSDANDAHIIAGAVAAQVRYLITYNLKHYKIDRIKDEFNIIIMTPALFLQYLRST